MKWNTQRRRNASGSSFSALLVMMTTGRWVAATSSPVSVTVKRIRSSSCSRSLGNSMSALSISSMSSTTRCSALERPAQRPHVDVLADVAHVVVAEPAVVQPLHGVVVVQPLLRAGGALDVPGDQLHAQRLGHGLGQQGLAGAGLAADEQRLLQHQGAAHGRLERGIGQVGRGAGELHGGSFSTVRQAYARDGGPTPSSVASSQHEEMRMPIRATIQWPGDDYPLGAIVQRRRDQLRALRRARPTQVELCLIDEHGGEQRIDLEEKQSGRLAHLPADGRARASATGSGCTARGIRRTACATTRTSSCSTRTPRRSPAWRTTARPCSVTGSAHPDERDTTDSLGHTMLVGGHQPVLRLDRRTPARRPYNETVIYEAHVKGMTIHHPDIPRDAAGHLRGPGPPGDDRLPASTSASTPSSSCRSTSSCRTRFLPGQGRRNYWGYNTIGFFAPHNEYSATGTLRRAGQRVQGDGPANCTGPASR